LKKMMKIVLVALLLCVCVNAHMCLVSPYQRGASVNLTSVGLNECYLLDGPCGGQDQSDIKFVAITGIAFPVVFQKNLNHFNSSAPGTFSVSYAADGQNFQLIAKMADDASPDLSVYTIDVTIGQSSDAAVLQVTYDIGGGTVFYQCSDFAVIDMNMIPMK